MSLVVINVSCLERVIFSQAAFLFLQWHLPSRLVVQILLLMITLPGPDAVSLLLLPKRNFIRDYIEERNAKQTHHSYHKAHCETSLIRTFIS